MAERKSEVKTFITNHLCDDETCPGFLEQVGKIEWNKDPIIYPHKCNFCGKEYILPKKYPKLNYEYRKIGE